MADYTQLMNLEKKPKGQSSSTATQQPTHQSTSQPATQSVRQPSEQPTHSSAHLSDTTTVIRPKSFYITVRLDKRLDEAVRYFQEVHNIKKVDRSILLNAMLDTDAQWTEEALDLLVARIIS